MFFFVGCYCSFNGVLECRLGGGIVGVRGMYVFCWSNFIFCLNVSSCVLCGDEIIGFEVVCVWRRFSFIVIYL